MDKTLEHLKETLEDEIKKIVKKGDITPAELESVKNAVCTIDMIENMGMGGQSEGYSNRRMSLYYDNMPSYRGSYDHAYNNYRDPYYDNYHGDSYERGRSPVTGRYISNGSYERGYSGHSIKDRMIARLEDMYDDAKTEHERQVVSETIQKIQSGR